MKTNFSANPKIGFINLGCPKNLVDAERIITQLQMEGYEIVTTYEEADLIIINTCGFINEAIAESLETIADALEQHGKVIVTGCLGVNKETILAKYPQVLHVSGPNKYQTVLIAVHKHLPPKHKLEPDLVPDHGIKLTPPHYAYIKISEGCNHHCTFCIIPQLRGKLISRPITEIVNEAKQLVASGVKELIIISQDTTAYGSDLKPQANLIQLVTELGKLSEHDIWIRLHYLYPNPIIEEILPLMAEQKILPYLDVPFQHCNSRILTLMQRPGRHEKILEQITKWRSICPNLTIRSTFITGFPGETDTEFNELLEFLAAAQLDRVGCFKYSPVKGARANELADQIPEEIKLERQEILMTQQEEISATLLQNKIGKIIPVIIDEIDEDKAIGRTQGDAPEIDGVVYITNASKLQPGNIVATLIKDSNEHDLFGTLSS